MSADIAPRFVVRTELRDTCSLAQALAGDVTAAWLNGDEGLVGVGIAAKLPLREGLDEAAALVCAATALRMSEKSSRIRSFCRASFTSRLQDTTSE